MAFGNSTYPIPKVVPTGVINETKCEMSLPSVLVTLEWPEWFSCAIPEIRNFTLKFRISGFFSGFPDFFPVFRNLENEGKSRKSGKNTGNPEFSGFQMKTTLGENGWLNWWSFGYYYWNMDIGFPSPTAWICFLPLVGIWNIIPRGSLSWLVATQDDIPDPHLW